MSSSLCACGADFYGRMGCPHIAVARGELGQVHEDGVPRLDLAVDAEAQRDVQRHACLHGAELEVRGVEGLGRRDVVCTLNQGRKGVRRADVLRCEGTYQRAMQQEK